METSVDDVGSSLWLFNIVKVKTMKNSENKTTMSIRLVHPEAHTVFNVICTDEQKKFLKFLSDISKNVSMNRYEPVISVSEDVQNCESDVLKEGTEKAFIFDATLL